MSERGSWKVNTAYSFTVLLFDATNAPKTGEASNFTTKLAKDDAPSAVAVTVSEIDSTNLPGFYKVVFTPTATGHWVCWVKHATLAPRGLLDEIQVGNAGTLDDVSTLVLAATVDGTITVKQALALIQSATVFNNTGEPNNPVSFKDPTGAIERIASTIDANGNRTVSVTPP